MRVTSHFDEMHGCLDFISCSMGVEYELQESKEEMFVKNRGVDVLINGVIVGHMGIVHPWTLNKFEIGFPVTLLELNIEKIKEFKCEFSIE